MTHEEKMRKMEMDHQARMAEIRRKREEQFEAVNRIEEENERRFEKLRAALNTNDFDEMRRINKELTDSLIKVRQILGIR